MEYFLIFPFGVIQFILCIIGACAYVYKGNNPEKKYLFQQFFKGTLSLGVFFCFKINYQDDFLRIFPSAGFEEFMILTGLSFSFIWLAQLSFFTKNKISSYLTSTMLGVCFWLALFTCVKFAPMIWVGFVPLFGLLVITPYLVLIVVSYEIRSLHKTYAHLHPAKSLSFSIATLMIIQLVMNFYAEQNWELISMFYFDVIPN